MSDFAFRLEAQSGQARAGILETAHGSVETPCFMAVGTQGAYGTLTNRSGALSRYDP
jgi:queuine tRNA-ribosyltransferase